MMGAGNVALIFLLAFLAGPEGTILLKIDFNRDIRPILADRCFACHGPDPTKRKGGLRLDDEVSAKAPRKNGLIAPKSPKDSLLIKRIHSIDPEEVMPPSDNNKPLSAAQKTLLSRWIEQGAPWSSHWAYAPLKSFDSKQTIDGLLTKSLFDNGLKLSPEADPVTLVRRLQFDLLGMIAKDPAPYLLKSKPLDSKGLENAIDAMLASDAHAERMATWWLDLVRYADTVGYHGDQDHNASPYRDWVIDAFAQNMRFDRFTQMQLAGDLMELKGPDALRAKIASCYNRLLQTSHEGGVQPKEYLAIYAADRVRNLSSVWLGATVGCAQCHSHKFDPYTHRDFYSLAAFFADIDEEKHLRGGGGDTVPTKRPPELAVVTDRDTLALKAAQSRLEKALDPSVPESVKPIKVSLLLAEVANLSKPRLVMITQSIPPRPTRVLARGNWMDEAGEVVDSGVPGFLGTLPNPKGRASRLDLALWMTDTQSGVGRLSARVLANRIWALFFGEGISANLEDLGSQGDPPTHPELLDHLANELILSGWDVRSLIKKIVSSKAYRQSSAATPSMRQRDPNNRLFLRQASFRLPAEMIRDNALSLSGLLDEKVGGPSIKPYQPEGYYSLLNFPKRGYKPSVGGDQFRRGLYIHWQRQFLHPMLRAFDAPSREECSVKRPNSNTPRAALVLLNDPTFIEAAKSLAKQHDSKASPSQGGLPELFKRVTGRRPVETELYELEELKKSALGWFTQNPKEAKSFLGGSNSGELSKDVELAALAFVCRLLFNLAETNTRN